MLASELAAGVFDRTTWTAFADRAAEIKRATVEFLETAPATGRSVAGYGAPGKA